MKQQQQDNAAKAAGSDPSETTKYRLLGDLPSLGGGDRGKQSGAAVALSLALYNTENNPAGKGANFMKSDAKSESAPKNASGDPSIPKVCKCMYIF